MSDFVISFRVLLPSDEMQFISLPLRVAASASNLRKRFFGAAAAAEDPQCALEILPERT